MKALYAEFTARDSQSANLVDELLAQLATAVRGEPGNLVFDAYRVSGHPNSFFVYELYRDDDAFASHLQQEHGRVFNEKLGGLVVGGGSELTFLDPIESPSSTAA